MTTCALQVVAGTRAIEGVMHVDVSTNVDSSSATTQRSRLRPAVGAGIGAVISNIGR